MTLRLHRVLYPQIERDEKLGRIYREIEMPVMDVLLAMERNGVLLDARCSRSSRRELGAKMLEIEARRTREAGQPFNLNSPKQIQEILFEQRKLPVIKKTPSGTPSTDEDVLRAARARSSAAEADPRIPRPSKLKSTYTDKLPSMINPETGRVHTNYGQAVAVTGRLASNDPNLQNIPIRTAEGRRIREAFIAPPGSHDRIGRLLADRAAHHGAHLAGRGPAQGVRGGRGHPPRDRRGGVRHGAGRGEHASSAATPR